MTEFMDDIELARASEARRERRAALCDLIRKAGLNPAEIDVTKMMSDEEQVALLKQRAADNEARELAQKLGKSGLRERLKQTIQRAVPMTQEFDPSKIEPPPG